MSNELLMTAPSKIRLALVRENDNPNPVVIRTAADASRYADELRRNPHEAVAIILLTCKNTAIGMHIASMGSINSAIISPDIVFKAALLANAAAIIIVHAHPSGNEAPSAEDLKVTRQMIEAGRILGIPVLDHVVLGSEDKFISIREAGLIDFRTM